MKILAVGELHAEHQEKADVYGSATLALSTEEAAAMMLALSHGVIHLILRPTGDTRLSGISQVGLSDLGRQSRARPSPAPESSESPDNFVPSKR